MKKFYRNLALMLIAFLFVAAFNARAGDAIISWTPPTQNMDGSPLIDLASYKVLYGTDQNMLTLQQPVTAPASSTAITNLSTGTWYFAVIAINQAGAVSDQSNIASKVIVPSVVDVTVYKQTQSINGYAMNKVGTIALGTSCDQNHVVDGYNLLPDRTAVTYLCGGSACPASKTIMPTSVYAKCQ